MSKILMVPIHLDALVLDKDQPVLEAMADFKRLPYQDNTRDVNGDTAYLSEELLSGPLQDQELYLKAGIHLHWALPDALTKGSHAPNGTKFPVVPNRWLVMRTRATEGGQNVTEKMWIVESDYLYAEGTGEVSGSVSFPVTPDQTSGKYCPFRFLGRNMDFGAWQSNDKDAEYLEELTAVGYGEPTFAAFYPNCHSLFGFYDSYTESGLDNLRYDILGWYSDPQKDCLSASASQGLPFDGELLEQLEKNFKWTIADQEILDLYNQDEQDQIISHFQTQGQMPTGSALALSIKKELGLRPAPAQVFPNCTLYYSRLTFNPAVDPDKNVMVDVPVPAITIGNTGTEALSAYLAHIIATTPADGAELEDSDAISQLKSRIEDQLEALSFSSNLNTRQLDIGPKFEEARHAKGFTSISSGELWSITLQSLEPTPADSTNAGLRAQLTLPEAMAHHLNDLNQRQQDYDRAIEEIESLRRQLFSDWYKYMICAYPPDGARDNYPNVDEVRNYIELKVLAPLQSKVAATGELQLQADDRKELQSASFSPSSQTESLAAQLAGAINQLIQTVAIFNESKSLVNANNEAVSPKDLNVAYRLKQVAAPSYYKPNEPVVLMTGPAVKPSVRHGQDGRLREDGLLECQLLQGADIQNMVRSNLALLTSKIDLIEKQAGENFAFDTWTAQPWNPFLLEWEVEVFPIADQSNLDTASGGYLPGFIKSNYSLLENEVDFSVRDGRGLVTTAANIYTGRSLLTQHASIHLKDKIKAYQDRTLDDYYRDQDIPQSDRTDDYYSRHLSEILRWYEQNTGSAALRNITSAYDLLAAPTFYSLSQALSGFNEALLMHKQTLQLDVADPLGFDDYQAFAANVREASKESVTSAPQPLNDFNPIRNGALKLLRLRLVDTFGQVRELDLSEVLTTEKLKPAGSPYPLMLPPRLTQPCRINFRWLAADQESEQEMNDHPATSPICGWVLPNNLDNSLMIYTGDGAALGSIDQEAKWRPAPGSDTPIPIEQIPNTHLRKMVLYLCERGGEFLQDFISALDNALEKIEPENFAQHQDIALLMGSPLALARASLNLELQGLPALHQGWNVFRLDVTRNTRDTNDFNHVHFPIRVGEYRQFNDGLVGYWKESGDRYEDDLFYAPQSEPISDGHIKTHADKKTGDDPMIIYQTVTAPPQTLSMLVDPRGSVHVTSGIVPVKAITIPPDQYTNALKAVEITFLSTPILTDQGRLRLPLPAEPGYEWAWLQKEKDSWSEISSPGVARKQTFLNAFNTNGEAVWNSLKTSGWIVEIDDARATITPRDKRTNAELESSLAAQVPLIESILDQAQIGAPATGAVFTGQQKIVEGWLKLSNAKTTGRNDELKTNSISSERN